MPSRRKSGASPIPESAQHNIHHDVRLGSDAVTFGRLACGFAGRTADRSAIVAPRLTRLRLVVCRCRRVNGVPIPLGITPKPLSSRYCIDLHRSPRLAHPASRICSLASAINARRSPSCILELGSGGKKVPCRRYPSIGRVATPLFSSSLSGMATQPGVAVQL